MALLATSVAMGLWSRSALRQKRAVETLRAGGWSVGYGDADEDAEDNWLARILGVDFVYSATAVLERPTNTLSREQFIATLRQLPRLRFLVAVRLPLADDDLQVLGQLNELIALRMENCSLITDEGRTHLRELQRLRLAHLTNARFTPRGVRQLAELPIQQLNLDLDVAHAAINELRQFKSLLVMCNYDDLNDTSDDRIDEASQRRELVQRQLEEALPDRLIMSDIWDASAPDWPWNVPE
ncbi:MAG: hypothetical protein K2Y37_16745 [Pirellulales bacterium]|nr:hypothetical protein [Pirellulales bacterium]